MISLPTSFFIQKAYAGTRFYLNQDKKFISYQMLVTNNGHCHFPFATNISCEVSFGLFLVSLYIMIYVIELCTTIVFPSSNELLSVFPFLSVFCFSNMQQVVYFYNCFIGKVAQQKRGFNYVNIFDTWVVMFTTLIAQVSYLQILLQVIMVPQYTCYFVSFG